MGIPSVRARALGASVDLIAAADFAPRRFRICCRVGTASPPMSSTTKPGEMRSSYSGTDRLRGATSSLRDWKLEIMPYNVRNVPRYPKSLFTSYLIASGPLQRIRGRLWNAATSRIAFAVVMHRDLGCCATHFASLTKVNRSSHDFLIVRTNRSAWRSSSRFVPAISPISPTVHPVKYRNA